MFYEIFRIIGLVTGYPFQLLFFKRKTYFVDKKNTHLLNDNENSCLFNFLFPNRMREKELTLLQKMTRVQHDDETGTKKKQCC